MSSSLLAFLTLLEKRALPLLPGEKTWRFQRLVDFQTAQAVLQLWEDPDGPAPAILSGQVDLRVALHEDGTPAFSGTLSSAASGSGVRKFSFHPKSEADVEKQAGLVAEMWRKSVGAEG